MPLILMKRDVWFSPEGLGIWVEVEVDFRFSSKPCSSVEFQRHVSKCSSYTKSLKALKESDCFDLSGTRAGRMCGFICDGFKLQQATVNRFTHWGYA